IFVIALDFALWIIREPITQTNCAILSNRRGVAWPKIWTLPEIARYARGLAHRQSNLNAHRRLLPRAESSHAALAAESGRTDRRIAGRAGGSARTGDDLHRAGRN